MGATFVVISRERRWGDDDDDDVVVAVTSGMDVDARRDMFTFSKIN